MARLFMFAVLALVILGAAVFSVTTKRIMRAATALLFVLFGIAGLYFVLGYTFLGATQISIYAGGITMIYIFAIQLVSKRTLQGMTERWLGKRTITAALIAGIGFLTVAFAFLKTRVFDAVCAKGGCAMTSCAEGNCPIGKSLKQAFSGAESPLTEIDMSTIGTALVGADKYQYVLPFEFISLFLLACIIGGLVILNIKKGEETK